MDFDSSSLVSVNLKKRVKIDRNLLLLKQKREDYYMAPKIPCIIRTCFVTIAQCLKVGNFIKKRGLFRPTGFIQEKESKV